jgi:hypothetical protein
MDSYILAQYKLSGTYFLVPDVGHGALEGVDGAGHLGGLPDGLGGVIFTDGGFGVLEVPPVALVETKVVVSSPVERTLMAQFPGEGA